MICVAFRPRSVTVLLIACGTPSNPTMKFKKNAAVIIKSSIAEVFIVAMKASCSIGKLNLRLIAARPNAKTTPSAAASVGVAQPP